MSIFDFLKAKKFKKEISELKNEIDELKSENDELKSIKYDINQLSYKDLKLETEKVSKNRDTLLSEIETLNSEKETIIRNKNSEIANLNLTINSLKNNIVNLEEEDLMQSFGFYNPKYDFENSEIYKEKLKEIRDSQKQMVKSKEAVYYYDSWQLDGSLKEGRKMNNDNIKLIIRSFNNECDACICKAKFNNIDSIKKRIEKAYNMLNKLAKRMKISIKYSYLELKFEELSLVHEYAVKKQEEKEEQRIIKERMKEERKIQKEIEREKQKIEKEETHFNKAIEELEAKLKQAKEDEKNKYENKLNELKNTLLKVQGQKQNVLDREKNTRAGYVYIISNIGSLGEDIYKIGMTRRLEPNDRVKELSNASVPFPFDVHAMIYSEDAPTLENKLHKYFDENRVNKINVRKEFFNVSLQQIQKVVNSNFNEVVEFTKLAEASEYRQTLKLSDSSEDIAS